jgi:site-specific DNA-methyltransferase (adenine-specific)
VFFSHKEYIKIMKFIIEPNKIYNCDCLKGMKNISDESIDMIITDPPYGINYKSNKQKPK